VEDAAIAKESPKYPLNKKKDVRKRKKGKSSTRKVMRGKYKGGKVAESKGSSKKYWGRGAAGRRSTLETSGVVRQEGNSRGKPVP